jgi:hypothetical protein
MHADFHLELAENQQERGVIEAGDAGCFGVKAKMNLWMKPIFMLRQLDFPILWNGEARQNWSRGSNEVNPAGSIVTTRLFRSRVSLPTPVLALPS